MTESFIASLGVELAVVVANILLGYVALVARKVNQKLDLVDDHDRALYGDEKTGWPGLMSLFDPDDPDVCADGGEVNDG